ncbi:MAG: HlyD family efflux transporter periplasmic adaptor subunit [Phycisphaerae bacterium]|nr:HlyD family efflux transporter periplasmic adaptor subunit [Phycisphaerae bacterium]
MIGTTRMTRHTLGAAVACLALSTACTREEPPVAPAAMTTAPAITDRVDIPAAVRANLGITFAKVEYRAVARTLRVPGHFELLPTARREYRAALPGRAELLVEQYQAVETGAPLYILDSVKWRELQEQIAAAESGVEQASARLASMPPLREAHGRHERSLVDKVTLWEERLVQLEELRRAGGGSAAQFTEAKATLNATQAELADVMERDAELEADQLSTEAGLKAATARRDLLLSSASALSGMSVNELLAPSGDAAADRPRWRDMPTLTVRATRGGFIESLAITNGRFVAESDEVLTVVQPDHIRFRARGLQADLGRLRDGLQARVVPPTGAALDQQDALVSTLQIGLTADADSRTVDLFLTPTRAAAWARAGVSAYLEITLDGAAEELAVPLAVIARDGLTPIMFRRDPKDPDKVIRIPADLGVNDGRWVIVQSGVKEGDEIVLDGVYQLMLATAGNAPKGGHFHSDGTFHEGAD